MLDTGKVQQQRGKESLQLKAGEELRAIRPRMQCPCRSLRRAMKLRPLSMQLSREQKGRLSTDFIEVVDLPFRIPRIEPS
jgi:hypothetical protein